MAKNRTGGFFSCFLYDIGKKIRFYPDSSFAPARSEKKEKAKPSFLLPYRRAVQLQLAKMREQSYFYQWYSGFIRSLFSTRIRSFGLLFFTCGFLQILFYFLGSRVPFLMAKAENLLFGVCQIFFSLLCTFARGDLENSLKKSFLFRAVIHPLFGVEPWRLPGGRKHDSSFVMILSGVFLALLSVWFTPMKVLFFALLFVLVFFVFSMPEAGIYITALLFFLLSSRALTFLLVLTLISFFCKWLVGKRSITLGLSQWSAMLFLLALFVFGREKNFVFAFQCLALYFLISCVIRTTASLRRVMFSLVLGALFCAGMFCLGEISDHPILLPVFQKIDVRALLVVFQKAQLGAFLALIFPLVLGLSRSLRWEGKIALFTVFFLCQCATFYFLEIPVLWNALFLALMLFGLFSYRPFLILLCLFGTLFFTVQNLLPLPILDVVKEFFGVGAAAEEGTLFASMYGQWGIFLFICLLPVLELICYRLVRFRKDTTRPAVYPLVLGVAVSVAVFLYFGFCPVPFTRQIFLLFVCMPAFLEVAYKGAVREEISLPY